MKCLRISAIWCPSCLVTYSIWTEVKEQYPSFAFEEYDYDQDFEKIEPYHIGSILPVVILFKEGKEVARMIGEKSKQEIIEVIEQCK